MVFAGLRREIFWIEAVLNLKRLATIGLSNREQEYLVAEKSATFPSHVGVNDRRRAKGPIEGGSVRRTRSLSGFNLYLGEAS